VHTDFLILDYALQVNMHNRMPGRMALDILDDGRLGQVSDLDIEYTRLKRLALHLVQQLVVIECQSARFTTTAIEDCGYSSLVTQAAARTFPLVVSEFRNQIEFLSHV
jgi:hypothetical protein